jgi:hypothetical protein
MEKRYAGKSSQNMLADYCWNLIEEMSIASTNELQKEVLNVSKIKYLFSHFSCSFQHKKVTLNQLHNCSKNH